MTAPSYRSYEQETAYNALQGLLEDLICSLLQSRLPGALKKGRSSRKGLPITRCSIKWLQQVAALMRTAQIIHAALGEGRRLQKRDIFYRDCSLFRSQSTSDSCVERIARWLNMPREHLGVFGATRGIMYGGWLQLCTNTGTLDVLPNGSRHIVPYVQDIVSLDTSIDFVLIVEKEAVFNMIVDGYDEVREGIGQKSFLAVTSKGYPDRATQLFLGMLRMQKPCMRFLILVDWDPFGMDIYVKYRDGLRDCYCAIYDLCLVGLKMSDVSEEDMTSLAVPLTGHDKKRLYSLLKNEGDACLRKELLRMNDINGKMEVDILANDSCLLFTNAYMIRVLLDVLNEPWPAV